MERSEKDQRKGAGAQRHKVRAAPGPTSASLRLCVDLFSLLRSPVGGDLDASVSMDFDGDGSVAVGSGVFDASLAQAVEDERRGDRAGAVSSCGDDGELWLYGIEERTRGGASRAVVGELQDFGSKVHSGADETSLEIRGHVRRDDWGPCSLWSLRHDYRH